MNVVAIVDYGLCNLDSIRRIVEECGGEPVVTNRASNLEIANRIILPGVGSFADAMHNIRQLEMDTVLHQQVTEEGIPLLGICLGMQLLAQRGYEGGETEGLGFFNADVVRLEPGREAGEETLRVPHVGWNELHRTRQSPLWEGVPDGKDFYFVHSYHMRCRDEADVIARTRHGQWFASVVGRDQIFGMQFHPEKSRKLGLRLIKNFLAI